MIKGALPPPPPPRRPPVDHADDRRVVPKPSSIDNKLSILRNYRRARGLCIRYGDKWSVGHQCALVPQLHALEEVWTLCADAFQDCDTDEHSEEEQCATEQVFMLLSSSAMNGSVSPRTLQLKGVLAGQDLLILVDSRSSHSFLSTSIAATMPNLKKLTAPLCVKVADGNNIVCIEELQCAEWSVQGHSFHSTLRFLPLGSYDMIVSMDWLEAFSPMKVN
jgi:hypothetical protein